MRFFQRLSSLIWNPVFIAAKSMKSYMRLSIGIALLLGIIVQLGWTENKLPESRIPYVFAKYSSEIKSSFRRAEYGNLFFAFIFGVKQGISPETRNAFKKNNLGFLLSPTGIHLSGLFLLLNFFLNRFTNKKGKKRVKIFLLTLLLFIPNQDSLKRLAFLRLSFQLRGLTKRKISSSHVFLFVLIVSFCAGHFFHSPLGFLISIFYIGTFFFVSEENRFRLFVILFANQILLAIFLGNKVSFLSVICGATGILFFTFLFPACLTFFSLYWIIPVNWIEPMINIYVYLLKQSASFINGTFTSASIFLLISVWCLLHLNEWKIARAGFIMCLFLHTNTAMTPSFFAP